MIFQNFWIKPVPGKAPRQQPKDLRLVMWKEGFTIDDEPLRRYDDPANKTWDVTIFKNILNQISSF